MKVLLVIKLPPVFPFSHSLLSFSWNRLARPNLIGHQKEVLSWNVNLKQSLLILLVASCALKQHSQIQKNKRWSADEALVLKTIKGISFSQPEHNSGGTDKQLKHLLSPDAQYGSWIPRQFCVTFSSSYLLEINSILERWIVRAE